MTSLSLRPSGLPSTRRRSTALAAALLALTVFAAACGTSETDSAANATTETEVGTETGEAETVEGDPAQETTEEATDGDGDGEEAVSEDAVDSEASANGVDIDLFFDGAIVGDAEIEDCTLSGGTATTCYRITVAGEPVDYDIGPFCPSTTEASADEGGIWFDGEGIYDLDGAFILGLSELYDDGNWLLYDEDGNVNITDTEEAFDAAARPDVAEEYQNHCVEGRIEWLDNGEAITSTVLLPTSPVPADGTGGGRGNLGVTLNGVTIAASAPVDAILGAYTIAAFDDCGGHINPNDGYHLHGAVGCSEVEVEGHANIFGYALDGYAIHSPYADDGAEYTDLDSCGGHTTDDLGYHYHASPAAENAVIGCLSGQTATG